ncbi:hypothetical protein [Rhizobium glycinendophyticum]|uniref:Uncharacterized protein n=1 Tax=Rhizobium glycinendophyticum TaxID=2589807 RepID=A0A504U5U6_9HYPH|nr:hypothetical protein [Rhizobium glycinendophyticum]TPP09789.1 hypothetical protein FJQ55_02605 [Rhizobium glycinendophyticum]
MITTAAIAPTIRPGMGMQYTSEILDRKTGEMVSIDQGHWITMEELSEVFKIGRRQLATVLHQMNFLQIEGSGRNARNRIRDWVIAKGYGKRNKRKSDDMPFDVVSAEGVRWIAERWEAAKKAVEEKTSGPAKEAREALREFQKCRSGPMCGKQEIHWVADHFPHLTHDQMAQALSLSRQLVTRFMRIRSEQIANAKALRERHREPTRDTSRCVAQ